MLFVATALGAWQIEKYRSNVTVKTMKTMNGIGG